MTTEETLYIKIGSSIPDAVQSQMFGKPCFKIGGKAFVCFFKDCMVFKLPEIVREKVLALSGTKLFDPSGKKRPMKEWVQVPYEHSKEWKKLTKEASAYVQS